MNKSKLISIRFAFAVASALAASAVSSHAQGEMASGTVSGVLASDSSGDYDYTITLNNTSSSVSIGSFWYSWTPTISPFFYLPAGLISESAPAGWTASPVSNSIQYSGGSLAPGASINFQYVATFSPAQLTGLAGDSFVYHGGIETDAGFFLNVQTVAVPEPSCFGLLITGSLGLLAAGWRKLRA
jgi:hypothetical protein